MSDATTVAKYKIQPFDKWAGDFFASLCMNQVSLMQLMHDDGTASGLKSLAYRAYTAYVKSVEGWYAQHPEG